MKKALSLLLVLIFVVSCFSGCKGNGGKTDVTTENSGTTVATPPVTDAPPYNTELDNISFNGKTVKIHASDLSDMPRKEFEGASSGGDKVDEALWKRNRAAEAKLGVVIEFEYSEKMDIQMVARENYIAANPDVDIYAGYEVYALSLSKEGVLENLYNCEYLDTGSRWWNQNWNETVEYGGQLYGVVGDLNTSLYLKTFVTFVNNEMLENYYSGNVPDLYAIVNSGDWTIDYIMDLCGSIYDDSTGKEMNERDLLDTYGLLLAPISQPSQALLTACGYTWTGTDDEGKMIFTLGGDRNTAILQKIQSMFVAENEGVFIPDEFPGAYYYADIFKKGNLLCAMAPMFTAEQLAQTNVDYRLLPIPKYDKNMEEYRSSSQDSHTFCAVSSVSDAKVAAGAVLEYMGYLSEKDITPMYFGQFYKDKYASDPASMDMFDKIVSSITFEFAINWSRSLRDVLKKVRALACDPGLDIASEVAGYEGSCQAYLDDLLLALDNNISAEESPE